VRRKRVRRTRPGLVPRAAPRGYADHLGTDTPRKTPPHANTNTTHPFSGLWSFLLTRTFVSISIPSVFLFYPKLLDMDGLE